MPLHRSQVITMFRPTRCLVACLPLLVVAGCARPVPNGGAAPGPAPAPAAGGAAAPAPQAPDPGKFQDPANLNLQQLGDWMARYLSAGQGPAAPRLQALLDRWFPAHRETGTDQPLPFERLVEADLNGDGKPELVTALNAPAEGSRRLGAAYVLYQAAGGYKADMTPPPDLPDVVLATVADLTGDGRRAIVWYSSDRGAHTGYIDVFVSTWQPGQLKILPGPVHMSSPTLLKVDGRDLVVAGGLVGSAGAGMAQRPWTDRYRVENGAVRLVDRAFDRSEFAYHKLQDGIVAESYGHLDLALKAYQDATDPERTALMPGAVDPAQAGVFGQAVRAFARFRLGALLLQQGKATEAGQALAAADGPYAGLSQALRDAGERTEGCAAATAWATAHPAFLAALNSPFGYANPKWQPKDLCGPLPPSA